jgi:hypothetical protein
MKFNLILVALLLLALPIGVSAQTNNIRIPFAFIASDTSFTSGEYTVSTVTGHLKLAPEGVNQGVYLPCNWNGTVKADGKTTLVFEKLGDTYVLREYRAGEKGTSLSVPLSKRHAAWAKGYYAKARQPEYVLISTEM